MFDAKMDLRFLGPLAARAVTALESIAQSLGKMGRTADLQAQILTKHHDLTDDREPESLANARLHRRLSLRSALGVQDNDRG